MFHASFFFLIIYINTVHMRCIIGNMIINSIITLFEYFIKFTKSQIYSSYIFLSKMKHINLYSVKILI